MQNLHPRIQLALAAIDSNKEHPAHHGAPGALTVLKGVGAATAVWRPYPEANSIREIALHIAIHENGVANRLSGKNVLMGFKQWKFGWVVRCDALDEKQWQDEIDQVRATHERLVAAVTGFDPNLLDQTVGKKTIISAAEFIHSIGEHSLYHTAQMEMLKIFFACWTGKTNME
jgi:hypothetical protein